MDDLAERIRQRAQAIYEWRQLTGHGGTAEDDWLAAERLLEAEAHAASTEADANAATAESDAGDA